MIWETLKILNIFLTRLFPFRQFAHFFVICSFLNKPFATNDGFCVPNTIFKEYINGYCAEFVLIKNYRHTERMTQTINQLINLSAYHQSVINHRTIYSFLLQK